MKLLRKTKDVSSFREFDLVVIANTFDTAYENKLGLRRWTFEILWFDEEFIVVGILEVVYNLFHILGLHLWVYELLLLSQVGVSKYDGEGLSHDSVVIDEIDAYFGFVVVEKISLKPSVHIDSSFCDKFTRLFFFILTQRTHHIQFLLVALETDQVLCSWKEFCLQFDIVP